jgi:hypothetical protein
VGDAVDDLKRDVGGFHMSVRLATAASSFSISVIRHRVAWRAA